MKTTSKIICLSLLAIGLGACETIDEDRYASVACKDLKQLLATENLNTLAQSEQTGYYRARNDRYNRDAASILDVSDKDKKRQAELRAAYRNNCR